LNRIGVEIELNWSKQFNNWRKRFYDEI